MIGNRPRLKSEIEQAPIITKLVDLSKSKPPEIIDLKSFEEIREEKVSEFISGMKEIDPNYQLSDADPAMYAIERSAFDEMKLRYEVHDASLQNLIAYAKNENLEELVRFGNIKRQPVIDPDTKKPLINEETGRVLMETDASLRSRFLLSFDRYSTAGSKNAYEFQAKEVGTKIGLYDVKAFAEADKGPRRALKIPVSLFFEEKEQYDILERKIKTLLDSEIEEGNLKEYILNDDSEGKVNVSLLFLDQPTGNFEKDNEINEKINKKVEIIKAHLLSDDIKPLTDRLSVKAVIIRPIEIKAKIYVPAGVDKNIILKESYEKLVKYAHSRFKVGTDITVSGLHAALTVPNVNRVKLLTIDKDIVITDEETAELVFDNDSILVEVGE